jgi:maltose O-acetyltransferase
VQFGLSDVSQPSGPTLSARIPGRPQLIGTSTAQLHASSDTRNGSLKVTVEDVFVPLVRQLCVGDTTRTESRTQFQAAGERYPMGRTERQKMLAGELYDPADADLQAALKATQQWLARYNASLAKSLPEQRTLLLERLAAVGEGAVIRPPFHCDYGFNISLGTGVFLNFNCVILDVVAVTIGDRTQIGPAVQILTADHPRDPAGRASGLEFGRPIRIGRNVWIGGGAIILPGVTIGDDALIGAGRVVTRDVPASATAFGNPARIRH